MEIERTKGRSRASGSQVEDSESVRSRRNLERTKGWEKSVAQQSGPSWPPSPNVVINPPKNVTQDRSDKRFSAHQTTIPLFQPGAALSSAQLQDSSILRKPEISKSIRVTEPQVFLLKATLLQQQRLSEFPKRQRSQSHKHNSRNRSMESKTKQQCSKLPHNYFTNRFVIREGYHNSSWRSSQENRQSGPSGAELIHVIVHQKRLKNTEKMQYLIIGLTGKAKAAISSLSFSSQANYKAWDLLCKVFVDPES